MALWITRTALVHRCEQAGKDATEKQKPDTANRTRPK
jgi:hypothetical protein